MNVSAAIRDVDAEYVHVDKVVKAGFDLALPQCILKWYEIAHADEPVPPEITEKAERFLKAEAADGALDQLGEVGFSILHRCGSEFYFLLVVTWRNGNEMWESVYAKECDADEDFAIFPLLGPHRGTFCVWELAAVWHEREAWRRFLTSKRDENAVHNYLADKYQGTA